MKRIHLFEIEDLQWFPSFLRNYMTDFLRFLSNKTKIYRPIVPLLVEKLKITNTTQILDLASGGGGGLLWLNETLREEIPDLNITLSDYYPNLTAFEHTKAQASNFEYISKSVNAKNVPKSLKGFRTQFLSFHHFKPKDAQQILQNAVDSGANIAIIEAQDRSLPSLLGMLFSPITVLLTTPFIRPFSWGRLLFTYLIPILPLCVLWDGVVSCLRTYSPEELKSMVASLNKSETFDWEIGKTGGMRKEKGAPITYLFGINKENLPDD